MNVTKNLSICLVTIYAFAFSACDKQPVVKNDPDIIERKIGKIVFGEDWKEVEEGTNGGRPFKIINEKKQFGENDPIAWVVICEEPFGKTVIDVMWVKISEMGSETVINTDTFTTSDPAKHKNSAGKLDSCGMIFGNNSGRYKLKYFRDSTLLAEGELSYKAGTEN